MSIACVSSNWEFAATEREENGVEVYQSRMHRDRRISGHFQNKISDRRAHKQRRAIDRDNSAANSLTSHMQYSREERLHFRAQSVTGFCFSTLE